MSFSNAQVRIQSLYAGLDRTCILFGAALACSWVFAAFSYYLSRKTGTDWFTRSGSVMCLMGAAAAFRLAARLQNRLATGLKEGLASVRREIELSLEPPLLYQLILYSSYVTGIVGTAIWGYGDLVLSPAARCTMGT
jgi:hypothetical protein